MMPYQFKSMQFLDLSLGGAGAKYCSLKRIKVCKRRKLNLTGQYAFVYADSKFYEES
jgi:hypothetical protein